MHKAAFFTFTIMKKITLAAITAFTTIVFAACNSKPGIKTERETVKSDPVKTYQEIVKSEETTDTFNVALYETRYTFKYLIKISYKGIEATDSLRIPDLGYAPAPEIKAGTVRPSCIVGFLDDKQQFMEGNEALFEDNKLKFHTLKNYDVSQ